MNVSNRLNPVLVEIMNTRTVRDERGVNIPAFPTSINEAEGRALYNIVSDASINKTLEIGLAYGVSTLFICQAHYDKEVRKREARKDKHVQTSHEWHHTTIDPWQQSYWQNIGLLNIERAGYQNMVRFVEKPSQAALPELWQANEQFDFIFIDGAHLYDYAFLDFWYADQLIKQGGLIMLHDLIMPAIRKLLAFVLRNYTTYRIEPAFHFGKQPPWRKLTRLLRSFAQSPTDVYGWSLPFTQGYIDLFARNYCVLRKVGEDTRAWDHYQAF